MDVPLIASPVGVGLPPFAVETIGAGDFGEGAGVGTV